MLSPAVNQITQSPWARLVWAGVAVLALVQVVALYRLCTSQVSRAQARETVAVEQRNALTNCLGYTDRSTIASCSRRAAGQRDKDKRSLASRDLPPTSRAVMNSAVPVGYVFH